MTTEAPVARLAVIGTGLMGASFAFAARTATLATTVVGYDRDPHRLERALQTGAIDVAARSAAEAVEGCALVVIATPVEVITDCFKEIAEALSPGAVVTDVGSTKRRLVEQISPVVPEGVSFIGGHPLAGGEGEGPEAADPALFEGSVWVLTPVTGTDAASFAELSRWLRRLGAQIISLDPYRHDELMALTSHLPQVVASTLISFVSEASASEGLPILGAGGLNDMTRIAGSSPTLWTAILRENKTAIIEALGHFGSAVANVRGLIEADQWDSVSSWLAEARAARRELRLKAGVEAELVELLIAVPDKPGVLAEITTSLGEAGINIEDIDIVHSIETRRGTIHLLIGAGAAEEARHILESKGYSIHEA